MEINIRKINSSDKKIFKDFRIEFLLFNRKRHERPDLYKNFDKMISDMNEESNNIFNTLDKHTNLLVAELDSIPVGYALGRIIVNNDRENTGLFDEVYLTESARGYGIGKILLDEITMWIKSNNIKRMKLIAFSWNDSAKKMYEKNGFKEFSTTYDKILD